MEHIRWSEKSISFRELVNNPSIKKPVLVQIGSKSIIVGDEINGQFIRASSCKVSHDRTHILQQEIILSSKHPGIWRVISKGTSKNEGHIHRISTKHIEKLYKEDIQNERPIPRSYICTKDIEGFELFVRSHDPNILNGQQIDRQIKYIKENVEFEVIDIGEVEYTPTEGERTSQDFKIIPKREPTLFEILVPGMLPKERLICNRVLRTLYCSTKNESHKRRFRLEVNEQPCDIRPIASEGSAELRYLHSTQNLFDYLLNYGNDTVLYVKLVRGDPPLKSIEYNGYMVLKSILNGEKVPVCHVDNLEVSLVNPNLPIKVKLPIGDSTWHSLPKIRAAELQCMQLSISLLARHESEMYVTIETEKAGASFLQSSDNHEQRLLISSGTTKKQIEVNKSDNQISKSRLLKDVRTESSKPQIPKLTRTVTFSHPASDKLYRDEEKRNKEKQRKLIQDKPISSSSTSSNRHTTKRNIISNDKTIDK